MQEENDNENRPDATNHQTAMIAKLQEQIGKQNDNIRSKNRLLDEQTAEIDAVSVLVILFVFVLRALAFIVGLQLPSTSFSPFFNAVTIPELP